MQCSATAKTTGRRCKRSALPDCDMCAQHGHMAEVAKSRSETRDRDAPGVLYVMENGSQPEGWCKIGRTSRDIGAHARAQQLSAATGVALPFRVRHVWNTPRMLETERLVHSLLSAWRVNPRREFFRVRASVGEITAQFEGVVLRACTRVVIHCRWQHLAERLSARASHPSPQHPISQP